MAVCLSSHGLWLLDTLNASLVAEHVRLAAGQMLYKFLGSLRHLANDQELTRRDMEEPSQKEEYKGQLMSQT